MNRPSFVRLVPVLAVAFIAGGCATTSDTWDVGPTDGSTADVAHGDTGHGDGSDVRTDTGADVAHDTGHDTGTVHDTGVDTGARVCPTTCNFDTECQSMCPSPGAGSSFCCVFNSCTTIGMSTCPVTTTDSGTGGGDAISFDVPTFDGFSFDGLGGETGGCFGSTCTTDSDCTAACGAGARCLGGFCI